MKFTGMRLAGIFQIEIEPITDSRGWFARTYSKAEFTAATGFQGEWVQMNQSFTRQEGSIRGMHFQYPPAGECKLVRCISGAVFDVVVDLRRNSPTFLEWVGITLSADAANMIYIPIGFAHGFQTLTPDAQLIYHHSEVYSASAEGAIRFNDPVVAIRWPNPVGQVSDRDLSHPFLDDHFKGIEV